MANLAHSYAAITKADKNDDGTLTVYGKATDDSVDIDQQICDDEWLKRAMPDWMLSGGNVREQHSSIAAGVATDYEKKADGHYITALVVDPVSVKKVETGVLKGFSIGIRGPRVIRDEKAAGGRIIDGQIVEISLVDRPANPNAKLMLAKAAEGGLLMAVEQNSVPTPADVFGHLAKSDDAEPNIIEQAAEAIEDVVDNVADAIEEAVTDAADAIVEAVTDAAEAITDGVESTEDAIDNAIGVDDDAEKAAALLNISKGFLAELNKFDQATFDRARTELANLIIVEAKEMADEGYDEKDSIEHLLDSVKHLFRWYEGEVANGEVPDAIVSDTVDEIMLSADADVEKDVVVCECACARCDAGDGCDDKMCKCMKSVSSDKSVGIDEAVSTAIVEKAVAQAKESVMAELDLLKSALEAERAKAVDLADELATANKAVAAGGPKRTKSATAELPVNALLQKAAEYKVKADSTTDTVLAQGYRDLADEFAAKASGKDVK
jgi:hypothetical protein